MKIAIVGSGIAGLASAIRLRVKGHEVRVFESNSYPGGKLSEIRQDGFRFDAGPSLFTMPEFMEELFSLAQKDIRNYFTYKALDRSCHYFFEDGTRLIAWADQQKLADEWASLCGEPKENIIKALKKSAFLYEHLGDLFMRKSLHKWSTFLSKEAFKAYLRIPKFQFTKTLAESNQSNFKTPYLRQVFNRYATYNGSSPYETPATMQIIPHLEHGIGTFFPKGGMHSITQALYQLALDLGVTFAFNTPVSGIIVEGKVVKGIQVKSEKLFFDRVVSNMDVVNTYNKLLKDQAAPRKILNQPKSSSALIFYWGVGRSFPELDLHNILFSEDYKKEFHHIFHEQELYRDPTVYINVSSKYESTDAPEGKENWFVMVNTPNNQGQNWSVLIPQIREQVIKKISRVLKVDDFSKLIETEGLLDPVQIEAKTSSSQGALYGNSSNNRFAAFLRHSNAHSRIKGLYFCGGSVHPGGGIPLCLSSAKIVDDLFH